MPKGGQHAGKLRVEDFLDVKKTQLKGAKAESVTDKKKVRGQHSDGAPLICTVQGMDKHGDGLRQVHLSHMVLNDISLWRFCQFCVAGWYSLCQIQPQLVRLHRACSLHCWFVHVGVQACSVASCCGPDLKSTRDTLSCRFLLRVTATVTEASGNLERILTNAMTTRPVGGLAHLSGRGLGAPAGAVFWHASMASASHISSCVCCRPCTVLLPASVHKVLQLLLQQHHGFLI